MSPTEHRMLEVLRDGKHHSIDELKQCLFDGQGGIANVHPHLSSLRTQLKKKNISIVHVPMYILINHNVSETATKPVN